MRLFRNKKSGTLYEFIYEATDCTNYHIFQPRMVVYCCHGMLEGQIWVREKEEFFEKFEEIH